MHNKHFLIGLIISLLTMAWAIYGVNLSDVLKSIQMINYLWLIPPSVIILTELWCRAIRWRLFFIPSIILSNKRLFYLNNIGYLANNLLPLRAGDVVRAYLVGNSGRISKVQAFTTVMVEHIIDTLVVIILFLIILPFIPFIPSEIINYELIFGSAIIVIIGLLVLASNRKGFAGILLICLNPLAVLLANIGIKFRVESLLDGIGVFRSINITLKILTWSIFLWLCSIFIVYLMFIAFGFKLPWFVSIFLVCMTSLGICIPSSPGFVGVYHSIVIFSLTLFSVNKSDAFCFALVLHGWQYLILLLVGYFSLWKERVSFHELFNIKPPC